MLLGANPVMVLDPTCTSASPVPGPEAVWVPLRVQPAGTEVIVAVVSVKVYFWVVVEYDTVRLFVSPLVAIYVRAPPVRFSVDGVTRSSSASNCICFRTFRG